MKKNKEKINVLIPDGDVMFTLSIIRCLSHFRNIKIHLLSKTKLVETRFSRYIDSFTFYTSVKEDQEWIDIIKAEIVKREITVLFPVHIKNIRLLSKHRAEFEDLLENLLLPNTASFDIDMNVLSEDGIILAYSIQKGYIFSKLEYKAALGVEFLDVKNLYDEVEKVILELKWSGFAHIDLRYDGDQ